MGCQSNYLHAQKVATEWDLGENSISVIKPTVQSPTEKTRKQNFNLQSNFSNHCLVQSNCS